MNLSLDNADLRPLVAAVVAEVLDAVNAPDSPSGHTDKNQFRPCRHPAPQTPNKEIEVIHESETRCLAAFVPEMATLTADARTLWLFVYAANCESDCHCGEAGTREALSWMDAETFDRAFDDLRERRLIVRSVYDEQLLLEAITPDLMDDGEDWR